MIELKVGTFEPKYVSKLNVYLNAVDQQLRIGDDEESVGIILCAGRNETVADVALQRSSPRSPSPPGRRPHTAPPPLGPAETPPELAELDRVRARLASPRLAERVSQRATEITRRET